MALAVINRGVFLGFVLCLLILCLINGSSAITCLQCHNVQDVKMCTRFMECVDDEECNLMNCSTNIFGNINVTKSRRENGGLTICSECCYNDTCNTNLCGAHYLEKNDANKHCFQCKDIGGNETCSTTTQCQSDEACVASLTVITQNGPGLHKYDLECFNKRMCMILDRLPGPKDFECCYDDLCNTNPMSIKHVSETVVNTLKCPTNLVRPTTTQTTETTTTTSTPSIVTTSNPPTTASAYTTIGVNGCDVNPNICQNDGTCTNQPRAFSPGTNRPGTNTPGTYWCSCVSDWTGRHCEVPVDKCASRPCYNGGTCLNQGGAFYCACPVGSTGLRCHLVDACISAPCHGQATCDTSPYSGNPICSCGPDWTGLDCSVYMHNDTSLCVGCGLVG